MTPKAASLILIDDFQLDLLVRAPKRKPARPTVTANVCATTGKVLSLQVRK